MKRFVLLGALIAGVLTALLAPAIAQGQTIVGGPVVLMGIDAEDGGPFGHGPPVTYTNIVNNVHSQATKPASSGLLVIGCGKSAFDNVTTFWNAVFPAHTCVNGAAISTISFAPFRMIAVVSDQFNTPSGGLTCGGSTSEDARLDARASDIATHVSTGGGLLGFSSDCPVPYGYVSGLGTFSIGFPPQYQNIDPTPEGLALGVNDTLDVCCWHDVFLTFPSFLDVLAFRSGSTQAAAVGGREVILIPREPTTVTLDPLADTNPVGTQHCVTATVRDQFDDPMEGVVVRFSVTGSVTTSGSATTDANGEAEFCYTGPDFPGADVINAYADTDNDNTQDPGEPSAIPPAEKTWVLPVSTPGCEVKITNGGWIIAANGDRASFGGNARVDADGNASGNEEYQDHGPAQPMNLHGNVLVVVCNSATSATIYGTATIDGAGSFFYRLNVEDNNEPGTGFDKYWIAVANGYNSGNQTLRGGNVQIHGS